MWPLTRRFAGMALNQTAPEVKVLQFTYTDVRLRHIFSKKKKNGASNSSFEKEASIEIGNKLRAPIPYKVFIYVV